MHYKSIILEMLDDHQAIKSLLQKKRQLMEALDLLARQLKESHEQWIQECIARKPSLDSRTLTQQAMELATDEISRRLQTLSFRVADANLTDSDVMAILAKTGD